SNANYKISLFLSLLTVSDLSRDQGYQSINHSVNQPNQSISFEYREVRARPLFLKKTT
ncbi:hypothetical protein NEUTE1DRAFT_117867, partial [Neurospora tetrasperma FGSC 2508]